MITVSFASHRPETISLAYAEMVKNDVIILEEPSHPDFARMLDKAISISEYFIDSDIEYPEHGKSMPGSSVNSMVKGKEFTMLSRILIVYTRFMTTLPMGKSRVIL